jgi:acyl dehydratase
VIGKTIAEVAPGDVAQITRVVESGDVAHFVEAVGDHNPVHSDPAYAATTMFKAPIAPGIYLSQSLKFIRPVMFGDTINARVEVAEVIRERNRMRLVTVCTNQRGEEVLSGEAWVMPSRTAIVYEEAERAPLAALALQPWKFAAQALTFWGTLSLSMLAAAGRRA